MTINLVGGLKEQQKFIPLQFWRTDAQGRCWPGWYLLEVLKISFRPRF